MTPPRADWLQAEPPRLNRAPPACKRVLAGAVFFDAGDGAFPQGVFAAQAKAVGIVRAVSPDREMESVLLDARAFDEGVIILPERGTQFGSDKLYQRGLVKHDGLIRVDRGKNQRS